ncbi:MAG: hypothetical protein RL440_1251, partial [Bacteroidota bacterium]
MLIEASVQQKKNVIRYFFLLTVVLVLGRGGVQLRPIGIVDATALSSLEHAPIVLNTAFTVLKTTDDGSSQLLTLHSARALQRLLPDKQKQVHTTLPPNTNVVVLILESFGTNYAGPNSPKSYSPF